MAHRMKLRSGNFVGKESAFGSPPGHQVPSDILNDQFVKPMKGKNDGGRIHDGKTENDDGSSRNNKNMTIVGIRRKRYLRHTDYQIQQLESFFESTPYPEADEREALSRKLGLEPSQVKFWFQNKRTQMKIQYESYQNSMLQLEYQKLQSVNARLRDAIGNASCLKCGRHLSYDEHLLLLENARLREEIDRMKAIAEKHAGKPEPPRMP